MRTNYKEFKKIHEDANVATLKHPDGHEVKVAKGALSDHLKKQISSLKFCSGGEVEGYANGGEVRRDPTGNRIDKYNPELDPSKSNPTYKETPEKPHAVPVHNEEVVDSLKNGFKSAQHFANGGMSMPDGTEVQPSLEPQPPDMINQMANMQLPPPAQEAMPQNAIIEQPKQEPVPPQQPSVMEQGVANASQGLMGAAKAEGQLGQREAQLGQEQAKQQMNLESMYKEKTNHIMHQIAMVSDEVNSGHIDPNKYWHDRSTPGKIGTAIGLILGGMGAGISGGENPALKFLNSQIERNIEGQKANMENKNNALKGLQQQFGNLNDATNMYKAMSAGIFATKLMAEAAKSKDPLAIARAKAMVGELELKYGKDIQSVSQRQTLLEGAKHGIVNPGQLVAALVPEHDRAKAYEELQKAQEVQQSATMLDQTIDEAYKINTIANRTLSPNQSKSKLDALDINFLKVMKPILNNLSESDKEIAMSSKPTMLDNAATKQFKKENLRKLLNSTSATPILDSYGIKLPKVPQFHK